MKNFLRRLAWICLAIVVLLVVGVTVLVVWLQSASGSRYLLSRAQAAFASDPRDHLSFEDGAIRLLSGLHFKDLSLGWHRSGLDLEAKIDRLDLDYDFSLAKRRLEITDFVVEHPVIQLKRSVATEEPPPKKSARSYDEMLAHPPLQFALRRLRVHAMDLDYESANAAGDERVRMRGFNLAFALELFAENLRASGEVGFEPHAPAIAVAMTGATTLKTDVDFFGKWEALVQRRDGEWSYVVSPSNFHAGLANLSARTPTMAVSFPQARAEFGAKLTARSTKLFSFTEERAARAGGQTPEAIRAIDGQSSVDVSKISVEKAGAAFASISSAHAKLTAALAREIVYEFSTELKGLNAPAYFTRTVGAAWTASGTSTTDLAKSSFQSTASLEQWPLYKLKMQLEPDDQRWHAVGDVALTLTKALADVVKPAASLKKSGDVNATGTFDARVGAGTSDVKFTLLAPELAPSAVPSPVKVQAAGDVHVATVNEDKQIAFKGDVEVVNDDYGHWKLSSDLTLQKGASFTRSSGVTLIDEVEKGTSAKIPAVFTKPFKLTHKVALDAKRADIDVRAEVPHLEIAKLGTVDNTDFHFTTHSPDLAGLKDLDYEARLTQGPIKLSEAPSPGLPREIAGLAMKAKGTVREGTRYALESLEGDFDHSAIKVRAQGTADSKRKDAQAQLELELEVPKDFPELAGQKISGHLRVPARVSVFRGREVSIDGAVALSDLSWKKGDISLAGISGRFPYSEKLLWDGKQIKFMELITQNPFERVDFERVRPLLQGAEPLHIQKLMWEGKAYGPFNGFFSLTQNMFFAHQFDLDIMSGHLGGEMFFDIQPANLRYGLLARLTGLDLAEALPPKYLAKMPEGSPIVSARSGFVLNLRTGSIDGRVDVTEIGAAQLVAMINVLDPSYQDPKMNKVRSLLAYGYPTSVALAFADGYMDMNIALKVLGLGQDETIREIPIASLISKATAPILEKSQKGPIQ